MATRKEIHEGASATKPKAPDQWGRHVEHRKRHHRMGSKSDRMHMHAWVDASPISEKQLAILEQRDFVQDLFLEQQKAESLPNIDWAAWSTLARHIQEHQQLLKEQQDQIDKQQGEIDDLKRRLQSHLHPQAPVEPDIFQRWMNDHREEVAKHRGKHIAVHTQEGIIASADSYASLIKELERQGASDNDFVIEFVSPAFALKPK